MPKRRGMSVSSKMILTTTGLILGIVALFGAIDVRHMAGVFDEQSQHLSNFTMDNLRKRGDVQTRDLVQAGRSAVLNSDYATLQNFVPQLAGKDDREVAYAFVADKEGQVLAHTDASQNSTRVADAVGLELLATSQPQGKAFDAKRLLGFSRPIEQDGQRVGTVVIALNLAPLDEEVARIRAEKAASTSASTVRTILIGVMFILFGTALAVFQGMRISEPITRLAVSADMIARGDLSTRAQVTSSDEIGRLGESFNFMADQLVILLRETAEKAVLEKELEVARAIQETLVPPSDIVERKGLKVSGYFQPSSQCGGDWWTVNDLPGDKMLIVIGDVTGHGTPAAMITACAKAACDTVRNIASERLTPAYLLEVMNSAIYESARRRFVMTCFASVIDLRARTITFANAGHNFPYLYRAKGERAAAEVTGTETPPGTSAEPEMQVLMARGNPLGDVVNSTYAEKTQSIEPNDVLVWYTDGIVECENPRGEEFGDKRFRACIKACSALDPQAMRDEVVRQAATFFADQPVKDDVTMVFARVYA